MYWEHVLLCRIMARQPQPEMTGVVWLERDDTPDYVYRQGML